MMREWKSFFENYDVLYLFMGICALSLLLKIVSAFLFHRLLWDSNQMGTTENRWMKSMMSKFEAYYKLKISIHNVSNFVDRYLYRYHFLGFSLHVWEYVGVYFTGLIGGMAVLAFLMAGYFSLSIEWFLIFGFTLSCLFFLQGISELLINNRRGMKIFRVQIIDYMENTMRARLENEYFHQEESRQYQREYFSKPQCAEEKKSEEISEKRSEEKYDIGLKNQQMQELLLTLLEELKIDQDIEMKRQELRKEDENEKAQLFEEVLKEYI